MRYLAIILFLTGLVVGASTGVAEDSATERPFEELSTYEILETFSKKINPQKSMMESIVAGFSFPDVNENYGIRVAFGKADFSRGAPEDPDFSVRINDALWQKVLNGEVTIFDAISTPSADMSFIGSKPTFVKFMALFDTTENTKIRRY